MDLRRVVNQLYPDQDDPSPDFSSFDALIAAWRSPLSPPSQKEVDDKWADLQASDIPIKKEEFLNNEFEKQGVTIEAMVKALWEKTVKGDSTTADTLEVKREAIKDQFDK